MSKNNSLDQLEQRLYRKVADLERIINELRRVSQIPILTSDPSSPTNGQIWYNSTTGKFRKREGGTTKNLEST
jgi:hypothetical protein